MLVLTRKPGQRIYVGPELIITIVRLRGGRVRVGIDAPKGVPVWRGESEPRSETATTPAPATGPDGPV